MTSGLVKRKYKETDGAPMAVTAIIPTSGIS